MKRRIKIFLINSFLLTLMVAFNNCGQPGEIRFDHLPVGQSGDGSNQDSGVTPADPTGPATSPTPVVVPGPVVVTSPYIKVEKLITLSETQKAEVLFVVDNSISMAEEQSNMSSRFPLFIQNLKDINWRVGIITTDVDDATLATSDGKLLPFENGELFIDSKIPTLDAQNMFSKVIQRPESGSGYEQGIYATYRFLEREKARKIPFFRSDSSINIVFVSDSDETPYPDTNGVPLYTKRNKPDELVKYLTSNWPLKKFQFHSIVVRENDANCLAVSGNEAYGVTYEQLATLTKGVKGSVCAPDYGNQLAFLSEKIKDLIKSITLDCVPVIDPASKKAKFQIKVDGQPPVEIDRIVGKEVFLKGDLPTGQIKLEYYCPKNPVSN